MPALTHAELLALWQSVTDRGYSQPLLENPDSGVEALEQAIEQHARASVMIDRTTQAMFILPWSGQSDEPASGGVHAAVTLSITRETAFAAFVVLAAGTIAHHYPEDFSAEGTVYVQSGRRYLLGEPVFFLPGEAGPTLVQAVAEYPGHNYNLPLDGTITLIEQAGAGLTSTGASVLLTDTGNVLQLDVEPDVIGPGQVGQYVEFLSGANQGEVRQVVDYGPAVPGVHGGEVALDAAWVLEGTPSATPLVGEQLVQGTAIATVVAVRATTLVLDNGGAGTFVAGVANLLTSGGTFTISAVARSAWLVPETATAEWKVLSWADDLGVRVTNPASPTGGRAPMLDELGAERKVDRSPGEADATYRLRVASVADTVAPNAVRRAANDALAPWGITACLREIGQPAFFGMFYDAASSLDPDPDRSFAYDLDFALAPQDRYKLVVSLIESRGFFLVTIPEQFLGEFGIPYDATNDGPNGYDLAGELAFYDGFDAASSDVYGAVWNEVNRVHMGGVGFDLVLDDGACP